ncbi:MAG: putative histidine kinase [Firmicutes bacterium]|nr:putative histidine kinase [Bacillota bacterium]
MLHLMTKKTVLFFILLLFPLLLLYFYIEISFSDNKVSNTPQAHQGVLDLSDWIFAENSVIPLDGEWEFYWSQLLTYQDLHPGTNLPKNYAAVPSIWNHSNDNLPETGYATYRLKVKTADPNVVKGLKIRPAFTSYKLMVNDKVVATNGTVGKNPESYFPEYKPLISFFRTDETEFEIILQVANFTYARGGPSYSIYLGTDHQIIALREKAQQEAIFLLGAIFIMAVYHTALFLLQRKYNYKAEPYFVLIMVLFLLNTASRGEMVILNVFPSLSFHCLVFLQYTTIYWASAALALFMQALYPKECSARVTKVLVANSFLLTLFACFTPIAFYTKSTFTLYIQLLLILVATYYAYIAWLAVIRNRVGAALLFSTIIFSIGAYILDSALRWSLHSQTYIEVFPIVSLIFIFIQAFILAQRFSASFSEINSLSQKLLSLNKLKDDFMANTSHELRTPLHGIIAITESVLENSAAILPQQQKENLNLVVSSGKRLANLVNDILDYEKLKHGDIQLNKQSIDIQKIIPTALEASKYLAFSKPITLINNLPSDLPLIEADENRINQIIYNLLGNAIKFTDQGTITISTVKNNTMLEISVEDTGIGIANDKIDDIFKSFEQLSVASTGQYTGTGLGLSITKYLVEIHGGKIWASSAPGKGSTFTFSMPISIAGSPAADLVTHGYDNLPQALFKTPATFTPNGNFTVLLVDDDYANLQALINILAAENYSAIAVANGQEALTVLNQNKNIDLVILDIMLPTMSGYEICRKIRESYSLFELPVLMMTTQNSATSMLTGFAAGSNDFLTKPFNTSELKARMKTLLQLKKSVSKTRQAEMAFLQAQMKPHFLYNTLNTIMSFCWTDAEKAGQLLLALSNYLRSSFNFNNLNQFSTLEKELEFVESYMTIEKARFEDKLNYQYHIAVPPGTVVVPNLILQPLVENAIKHGILPKSEGGKIIISVEQQDSNILITIQDDGIGISQDKLSHILISPANNGVGLTNIDRRLKRIYGHGIQIVSKVNAGTTVIVKIPNTRKEVQYC